MSDEKKAEQEKSKKLVAAVRVRKIPDVRKDIKDTLNMLKLTRKNCCVVYEATPSIIGMLKKAQDYITYGYINPETLKTLVEMRGKSEKGIYRLNPPRKGYGRKGVKKPFTIGGALGNRAEKINELIKRMI